MQTARSRCRLYSGSFFFSILLLLALAFPLSAGEIIQVDGIPHVRNGSTPSEGRQLLHLEEAWRIGGDDEEGILLGLVSQIRGDEQGNILVMDAQLCQVHVYSPEGELLRTLFAQGEGPGETLRPRDMLVTADGVGMIEEFPGKVIMVDHQGLPLDNIRVGGHDQDEGFYALITGNTGGNNMVIACTNIRMTDTPGVQDRNNYLISLGADGKELVRYCEADGSRDMNNFKFVESHQIPNFWWGHTVGSDGRVYATLEREEYKITVFNQDGSLDRVIEREYSPYQRSDVDSERIRGMFENAAVGIPVEVEFILEDTEPAIDYFHRGLRVTDDGFLWVTSSRGLRDQPDGVMLTYDVFDPTGHFVRQIAVICKGDSYWDSLFWISDDRVVLVKGAMSALIAQFGRRAALDDDEEEEPTPQEVICYRVVD